MKNFWNDRYSSNEYVYGTLPNEFFKAEIDKIKPGKILMLGEGEGRNAVYAARLGWYVDAIDSSSAAKKKAVRLAKQNHVSINYRVADILSYDFTKDHYDAVGIIFLHMNQSESETLFKFCNDALKKDGKIILELFSHNQLGKSSGGPQDLSKLYSVEQIRKNFSTLKHELLQEEKIILSESKFHEGEASVIRFVGVK